MCPALTVHLFIGSNEINKINKKKKKDAKANKKWRLAVIIHKRLCLMFDLSYRRGCSKQTKGCVWPFFFIHPPQSRFNPAENPPRRFFSPFKYGSLENNSFFGTFVYYSYALFHSNVHLLFNGIILCLFSRKFYPCAWINVALKLFNQYGEYKKRLA